MAKAQNTLFVGVDRLAILEEICDLWKECKSGGRSRLVVIEGQPGSGKTRLVQEFYARLAASQPKPGYWPPRIEPPIKESGKGGASALASRGLITPKDTFKYKKRVRQSYSWAGVTCRLGENTNEPIRALIDTKGTFKALNEDALRRIDQWKRILRALGAISVALVGLVLFVLNLVGVVAPVLIAIGATLTAMDLRAERGSFKRLADEARRWLRWRRIVDIDPGKETIKESGEARDWISEQLTKLASDQLPGVVVVDDASWADDDTVKLVERLLTGPYQVLILATVRPDPYQSQKKEGKEGTFGGLVNDFESRTVNRELDSLDVGELTELVRARAPRTKLAVIRALVEKASGNPLFLIAGLDSDLLANSIADRAYQISPEDAREAVPNDYGGVFEKYWGQLPSDVCELLAVASIHGLLVQPDSLGVGYSAVFDNDFKQLIRQARDPYWWLTQIGASTDVDKFRDPGLFSAAKEQRGRKVVGPTSLGNARSKMISDLVERRRSGSRWTHLTNRARRVLLNVHVLAAQKEMPGIARDREAALSALELAELAYSSEEEAEANKYAGYALEWEKEDEPIIDRARSIRASSLLITHPSKAVDLFNAQLQYRERVDHEYISQTRYKLADALSRAGRPKEAIAQFEALLAVSERVPSPEPGRPDDTLWTRFGLASALRKASRITDAITQFEKLLADQKRVLGSNHPDTFRTRYELATALWKAGKKARATALLDEVLADQVRALGSNHPDTFRTRYSLALSLVHRGRPKEAIAQFEALLKDQERILTPEHRDTFATRRELAHTLFKVGRRDDAIALLKEVQEDQERVLGRDDPHTLQTRLSLAYNLGRIGQIAEASTQFDALLADQERALGQHSDIDKTRWSLADTLIEANRATDAITQLKALLKDQERVLEPDHPNTLWTRWRLASTLSDAGQTAEAITQFKALLADQERVLDPDDPDTLRTRWRLASTLSDAGQTAEAITQFKALLADQERVLDSDDPDTLRTRWNLAVALQHDGQTAEAIAQFETLLADQKRVLGSDHSDTFTTRSNLIFAYSETKPGTETIAQLTIAQFEALLADQKRVLGSEHRDTLWTRYRLALALGKNREDTEVIAQLEALLADQERVLGHDDPDTYRTRKAVAHLFSDAGQYLEAIAWYEALLADQVRVLDPNDYRTFDTRYDLACVYLYAEQTTEAIAQYEALLPIQERVLGTEHEDTLRTRDGLVWALNHAGQTAEAIARYESLLAEQGRVLGPDDPATLTTFRLLSALRGD